MARTDMIRVERGAEVSPGIWEYTVASLRLCGKSRQPLLDACRQVKSMGDFAHVQQIGIYREGRDDPDMVCTVEAGAAYTVSELARGGGPKFVKYQTFDFSGLRQEKETA